MKQENDGFGLGMQKSSAGEVGCGTAAGNDGANKTSRGRRSWSFPLVYQLLSGHTEALPGLKCPFKLYTEIWGWKRMGISVLSS